MEFKLSSETLEMLKNSPVDKSLRDSRLKKEISPRGSVYLQLGRILSMSEVDKFLSKI